MPADHDFKIQARYSTTQIYGPNLQYKLIDFIKGYR